MYVYGARVFNEAVTLLIKMSLRRAPPVSMDIEASQPKAKSPPTLQTEFDSFVMSLDRLEVYFSRMSTCVCHDIDSNPFIETQSFVRRIIHSLLPSKNHIEEVTLEPDLYGPLVCSLALTLILFDLEWSIPIGVVLG